MKNEEYFSLKHETSMIKMRTFLLEFMPLILLKDRILKMSLHLYIQTSGCSSVIKANVEY